MSNCAEDFNSFLQNQSQYFGMGMLEQLKTSDWTTFGVVGGKQKEKKERLWHEGDNARVL